MTKTSAFLTACLLTLSACRSSFDQDDDFDTGTSDSGSGDPSGSTEDGSEAGTSSSGGSSGGSSGDGDGDGDGDSSGDGDGDGDGDSSGDGDGDGDGDSSGDGDGDGDGDQIPQYELAHWSFDQGTWDGSWLTDTTGNGYDAYLAANGTTGAMFNVAGEGWSANPMWNTGYDWWFEVPDAPGLDLDSDFAVSLWVRNPQRNILAKSQGLYVRAGDGTGITAGFSGPQGCGVETLGTLPLQDGQWHHIGLTFQGTQMRLYVDWAEEDLSYCSGAAPGNTSNPFVLGAGVGGALPYVGMLDEVRLFNVGLTIEEICAENGGSWADTCVF